YDSNRVMRNLKGRVVDVHTPLVSTAKVCAAGMDIWIGNDGGYMVKKDSSIAIGMRKRFTELVKMHGGGNMVPVYEKNGVFVFDFFMKDGADAGKSVDLAPVEETSAVPVGFPRQARKL
ncbi:MAG: hypothetical protein ACKPKO_63165, partial [Candidatus Fonsibacter sp.]